jgi:alkylation response protein AidB-like acyl-CoA dehydrogenase
MTDQLRTAAGDLAGRVRARGGGRGGDADLRRRVAELEAEVQECRQLNLRIAELTDLVTDLLVPLSRGDQEAVRATLAKYQESI